MSLSPPTRPPCGCGQSPQTPPLLVRPLSILFPSSFCSYSPLPLPLAPPLTRALVCVAVSVLGQAVTKDVSVPVPLLHDTNRIEVAPPLQPLTSPLCAPPFK